MIKEFKHRLEPIYKVMGIGRALLLAACTLPADKEPIYKLTSGKIATPRTPAGRCF